MDMKNKGIAIIIGIVIVFGGLYAIGSRNKNKTDSSSDITTSTTTITTTNTPTTTENTTTTPTKTTTIAKNTTTNDNKNDYVLNTSTMKFHSPSCSSVGDIQPQNRKDVHTTSDDLKAQGYEPCGRCNPR
jgi:hypothetical protein